MFEQNLIEHHIQKHILKVLSLTEYAKYSEMRPEKTDSNLYAYHLNRLVLSGYVNKLDNGYTLSYKGLQYIEYASSNMNVRSQPKITTAILLNDNDGNILLTRRLKQPYINYCGLPLGKIHSNKDNCILDSAIRELYEKTGIRHSELMHNGDMYLKIHMDNVLVSDILVHVFSATYEQKDTTNKSSFWIARDDLNKINLIPGVKEIIKSIDSGNNFFEEISV